MLIVFVKDSKHAKDIYCTEDGILAILQLECNGVGESLVVSSISKLVAYMYDMYANSLLYFVRAFSNQPIGNKYK